ncbi:MAG: tol-pal system protein YbgF [Burkholderiales bacterium]|nr:tol-pal system protein YbgF [Burkholderiales bacterium]
MGLPYRAARAFGGLCLSTALFVPAAHAGLLEDDEARRAILELRQKFDQNAEQQRARLADLTDQINQLKRGLLDLNSQLEQARADNATLRGQNEQLTRDVADLQRQQRDLQSSLVDSMRKLAPQKVTVDGKEFTVEPEEKRQYDDAMALLRKSDFAGAANALSAFRQRYPGSGYGESVLFWLGNAQYGNRQYKDAIAAFRALVTAAPDNPHAPEALLAIANCQAELKDAQSARRTIAELLKSYPKSDAAQAGKDRLASLK